MLETFVVSHEILLKQFSSIRCNIMTEPSPLTRDPSVQRNVPSGLCSLSFIGKSSISGSVDDIYRIF